MADGSSLIKSKLDEKGDNAAPKVNAIELSIQISQIHFLSVSFLKVPMTPAKFLLLKSEFSAESSCTNKIFHQAWTP